jgi:hypothetical protein
MTTVVLPAYYKRLFFRDVFGYVFLKKKNKRGKKNKTLFFFFLSLVSFFVVVTDFFFFFFFFFLSPLLQRAFLIFSLFSHSALTFGTLVACFWQYKINATRTRRSDFYKQQDLSRKAAK